MEPSNLDYKPGLAFQGLVRDRFGAFSQVSSSSDNDFLLIASFSRSALRLDSDSVALILQSVLGGNAPNFRVVHQTAWVFRFSVAGKNVGIMVHRLGKFICKSFALHFTLWRNGGPDWFREKAIWDKEQEAEWKPARRSARKTPLPTIHHPRPAKPFARSYADAAAQPVKPSPARRSVFQRVSYPASYFASNFRDEIHEAHLKNHHVGVSSKTCSSPIPGSSPAVSIFERPAPSTASKPGFSSPRVNPGDRVCFCCLSPLHLRASCTSLVRCKTCFGYGHVAKACWRKESRFYRPKSRPGPSPSPDTS
ncbi:unnamed protein product [Urochloa humidicola]